MENEWCMCQQKLGHKLLYEGGGRRKKGGEKGGKEGGKKKG